MIPETLQKLARWNGNNSSSNRSSQTEGLPNLSNLPKSSQIYHISEIFKSSIAYHSFIKISIHLTAPLFQCFSRLSISAGKTRIIHQNTRKCHQKPETSDQNPSQKQMYPFVLLNVKSCHTLVVGRTRKWGAGRWRTFLKPVCQVYCPHEGSSKQYRSTCDLTQFRSFGCKIKWLTGSSHPSRPTTPKMSLEQVA